VNVGDAIVNFNRFDLLFLLFLFGMFVLGFMQGTIRRLLGLGAMLFSFLFAANLTGPRTGTSSPTSTPRCSGS
jgi:uncharacterized membrane protein required for colicin V production